MTVVGALAGGTAAEGVAGAGAAAWGAAAWGVAARGLAAAWGVVSVVDWLAGALGVGVLVPDGVAIWEL